MFKRFIAHCILFPPALLLFLLMLFFVGMIECGKLVCKIIDWSLNTLSKEKL